MRIAIMSRNKRLYSTRRMVEEAKKRDHDVQVLDFLHCYMNITPASPTMHYRGEKLPDFDVVIPRIGASVTFYGAAVLRQFEMMGFSRPTSRWPLPAPRISCAHCSCLAARGWGCRSRVLRASRTMCPT